jgi:hypothetical protein
MLFSDPRGGQCSGVARFYLTLAVYSGSESPDRITALLGVQPDRTAVKGERLPAGTSPPQHGWFLTTKDVAIAGECDEHIAWLLDRVPRPEQLAELVRSGHEVRFWIFWDSEGSGGGGPFISAESIRRLADLGACLCIDAYIGGDEPEE